MTPKKEGTRKLRVRMWKGSTSRGPTSGKRGKRAPESWKEGSSSPSPTPRSPCPRNQDCGYSAYTRQMGRVPPPKPACASLEAHFFTSAHTCTEQNRYKYPPDPSGHTTLFGKSYIRTIFLLLLTPKSESASPNRRSQKPTLPGAHVMKSSWSRRAHRLPLRNKKPPRPAQILAAGPMPKKRRRKGSDAAQREKSETKPRRRNTMVSSAQTPAPRGLGSSFPGPLLVSPLLSTLFYCFFN